MHQPESTSQLLGLLLLLPFWSSPLPELLSLGLVHFSHSIPQLRCLLPKSKVPTAFLQRMRGQQFLSRTPLNPVKFN